MYGVVLPPYCKYLQKKLLRMVNSTYIRSSSILKERGRPVDKAVGEKYIVVVGLSINLRPPGPARGWGTEKPVVAYCT